MDEQPKSELAQALVTFQAQVPAIEKGRTAKIPTKAGGSYSYQYADLSDIWTAIRKPLEENGLAVTQFLEGGHDGWTGIVTTVWHKSGQSHTATIDVPTQGKTAQEAGSQFTYYKRYALGSALGISTEEDDDGQAGNSAPESETRPRASPNKTASDKQLAMLRSLMEKAGIEQAAINKRLGLIETSAEASAGIEKMQERLRSKEES